MELKCSQCKSNHLHIDISREKLTESKKNVQVILSYECRICGAVSDPYSAIVPRADTNEQIIKNFTEYIESQGGK